MAATENVPSVPEKPTYFCCIPKCGNVYRRSSEKHVSFHGFPSNRKLRRQWLQNTGLDQDPTFKIKLSSKVCSDHFHLSDFKKSTHGPRRFLEHGAVPFVSEALDQDEKMNRTRKRKHRSDTEFDEIEISSPTGETTAAFSLPRLSQGQVRSLSSVASVHSTCVSSIPGYRGTGNQRAVAVWPRGSVMSAGAMPQTMLVPAPGQASARLAWLPMVPTPGSSSSSALSHSLCMLLPTKPFCGASQASQTSASASSSSTPLGSLGASADENFRSIQVDDFVVEIDMAEPAQPEPFSLPQLKSASKESEPSFWKLGTVPSTEAGSQDNPTPNGAWKLVTNLPLTDRSVLARMNSEMKLASRGLCSETAGKESGQNGDSDGQCSRRHFSHAFSPYHQEQVSANTVDSFPTTARDAATYHRRLHQRLARKAQRSLKAEVMELRDSCQDLDIWQLQEKSEPGSNCPAEDSGIMLGEDYETDVYMDVDDSQNLDRANPFPGRVGESFKGTTPLQGNEKDWEGLSNLSASEKTDLKAEKPENHDCMEQFQSSVCGSGERPSGESPLPEFLPAVPDFAFSQCQSSFPWGASSGEHLTEAADSDDHSSGILCDSATGGAPGVLQSVDRGCRASCGSVEPILERMASEPPIEQEDPGQEDDSHPGLMITNVLGGFDEKTLECLSQSDESGGSLGSSGANAAAAAVVAEQTPSLVEQSLKFLAQDRSRESPVLSSSPVDVPSSITAPGVASFPILTPTPLAASSGIPTTSKVAFPSADTTGKKDKLDSRKRLTEKEVRKRKEVLKQRRVKYQKRNTLEISIRSLQEHSETQLLHKEIQEIRHQLAMLQATKLHLPQSNSASRQLLLKVEEQRQLKMQKTIAEQETKLNNLEARAKAQQAARDETRRRSEQDAAGLDVLNAMRRQCGLREIPSLPAPSSEAGRHGGTSLSPFLADQSAGAAQRQAAGVSQTRSVPASCLPTSIVVQRSTPPLCAFQPRQTVKPSWTTPSGSSRKTFPSVASRHVRKGMPLELTQDVKPQVKHFVLKKIDGQFILLDEKGKPMMHTDAASSLPGRQSGAGCIIQSSVPLVTSAVSSLSSLTLVGSSVASPAASGVPGPGISFSEAGRDWAATGVSGPCTSSFPGAPCSGPLDDRAMMLETYKGRPLEALPSVELSDKVGSETEADGGELDSPVLSLASAVPKPSLHDRVWEAADLVTQSSMVLQESEAAPCQRVCDLYGTLCREQLDSDGAACRNELAASPSKNGRPSGVEDLPTSHEDLDLNAAIELPASTVGQKSSGENVTEKLHGKNNTEFLRKHLKGILENNYKLKAKISESTPRKTASPCETSSSGKGSTPCKTPSPGKRSTPLKTPSPGKRSTPLKTPSPGKRSTPLKTPSPGKRSTLLKTPSPGKRSTPLKTPSPNKTPSANKLMSPNTGSSSASEMCEAMRDRNFFDIFQSLTGDAAETLAGDSSQKRNVSISHLPDVVPALRKRLFHKASSNAAPQEASTCRVSGADQAEVNLWQPGSVKDSTVNGATHMLPHSLDHVEKCKPLIQGDFEKEVEDPVTLMTCREVSPPKRRLVDPKRLRTDKPFCMRKLTRKNCCSMSGRLTQALTPCVVMLNHTDVPASYVSSQWVEEQWSGCDSECRRLDLMAKCLGRSINPLLLNKSGRLLKWHIPSALVPASRISRKSGAKAKEDL